MNSDSIAVYLRSGRLPSRFSKNLWLSCQVPLAASGKAAILSARLGFFGSITLSPPPGTQVERSSAIVDALKPSSRRLPRVGGSTAPAERTSLYSAFAPD